MHTLLQTKYKNKDIVSKYTQKSAYVSIFNFSYSRVLLEKLIYKQLENGNMSSEQKKRKVSHDIYSFFTSKKKAGDDGMYFYLMNIQCEILNLSGFASLLQNIIKSIFMFPK